MAKKKTTETPKVKGKVKIKALLPLVRVGLAYSEGNIFEIEAKVADQLIEDGLAELCGK